MSVLQKKIGPHQKNETDTGSSACRQTSGGQRGHFLVQLGGFVKGRSAQSVQTELGLHSLMPQFTFYIT